MEWQTRIVGHQEPVPAMAAKEAATTHREGPIGRFWGFLVDHEADNTAKKCVPLGVDCHLQLHLEPHPSNNEDLSTRGILKIADTVGVWRESLIFDNTQLSKNMGGYQRVLIVWGDKERRRIVTKCFCSITDIYP